MARRFDERKKQAIMAAAIRLITHNGFEATPISAIAREAGVAAGTIYIYFPNKQEMIKHLYRAVSQSLADFVIKDLGVTAPVKETIRRVWKNHIAYVLAHRLEYRFLEQFSNSPQIDRLTRKQGLSAVAPVMDQFERAKREGVVKDLPIEMIYVHLFAPINALIKMHRKDKFKFSDKRINQIFETSWRAISRP
jgi:TetR/AcrR family transcriptional regulator, repressor of fatR-cypB operon